MEFAGEVEAVGAAVTEFAVGDEVFGVDGLGAHAEFVVHAGERRDRAHAGRHELRGGCGGLRRRVHRALVPARRPTSGQGGASSSTAPRAPSEPRRCSSPSTSAPHVTAVCNTKNVELVQLARSGRVIDYTQEDFTKNGETYDVVFDAVGKTSFRRCRRSLKPGGIFIETDLGFMWHVPPLALADALDRRQAGRRSESRSTRRRTSSSQGARRGGGVPGRDRPDLPAGGRGRGDGLRRDGTEDRATSS